MYIQEIFKLGMKRDIPNLLEDCDEGIVLNLGSGNSPIDDAVNLDLPAWDADVMPIPFIDESVSQIHAYHFLEHTKNPVKVLQEIQRVLITGGHINIVVPYYTSQMQANDLDHRYQFTEDTWKILFNNTYYDKNKIKWEFEIHLNIIIGIVERNLCLMTQLVKI